MRSNDIEFTRGGAALANTLGTRTGGEINLEAANSIRLEEKVLITANSLFNIGNAGNIFIDSSSLNANNEALISAATRTEGNGGSITVNVNDTSIANQSVISTQADDNSEGEGGNIIIKGDRLQLSNNSLISSASLGSGDAGDLELNINENISLERSSQVSAEARLTESNARGGNIDLETRNLNVLDASQITTSTFSKGDSGAINLNIERGIFSGTGTVVSSQTEGSGESGNIFMSGEKLDIFDGAAITTATFEAGDGGDLTIETDEVILQNGVLSVLTRGEGNAGALKIEASTLSLSNRARILAETRGSGNAGNLSISADALTVASSSEISSTTDASGDAGIIFLDIDNVILTDLNSAIFAQPLANATGSGGRISLVGESLLVEDGAFISITTLGEGNAGNMEIEMRETNLSGLGSGLFARSVSNTNARGGNIQIEGSRLSVSDDASINSSTEGRGRAGNIEINTEDNVSLSNGGQITASTLGDGRGGNIRIRSNSSVGLTSSAQILSVASGNGDAGTIFIESDAIDLDDSSGIASFVNRDASGKGGFLDLRSEQLNLSNASFISGSTLGQGDAGSISIQSSQLSVSERSAIAAQVEGVNDPAQGIVFFAEGSGGELTIDSDRIEVRNGGRISASTFGLGDAGNLTIRSSESLVLSDEGSNIEAAVRKPGESGLGGVLDIQSPTIEIIDGADINASTFGDGKAGDLRIQSEDLLLQVDELGDAPGDGGFIAVQSQSAGDAGSLVIESDRIRLIDLQPQDDFEPAIIADAFGSGEGGDVIIRTNNLIMNGGGLATVTDGPADGGQILIQPLNTGTEAKVILSNSAIVTTNARENASSEASGGNINVETTNFLLNSGAQVSTATLGAGAAGKLEVLADRVMLQDRDSGFLALVFGEDSTGDGGVLQIEAGALNISDGAIISSSSDGPGDAGDIELNLKHRLDASDAEISTESQLSGGGNISINLINEDVLVGDINLLQGSRLTASVFGGTGGGGDISTASLTFVALDDSDILAFADEGDGGNITIQAPVFLADVFAGDSSAEDADLRDFSQFFDNGRVDINASSRFGLDGTIRISDAGFLENTLAPLASDFSRADLVVAGSCLARQNADRGSFVVTGTGGLPRSPYESIRSPYQAIAVRPLETSSGAISQHESVPNPQHSDTWRLGDPIREAGQLAIAIDGRAYLSASAGTTRSVATVDQLTCQ
ncbi:MAG: hypothetical protein AAGB13_16995 [Cyanobacteria bacterium P01_F01_bin.33]